MRTKKQIFKEYLTHLNKIGNLGYSEAEIDKKVESPEESKVIEKLLHRAISETETYKGQTISTTNAFRTFCDFVIGDALSMGKRFWNAFIKRQFEIVEMNKLVAYFGARGFGKSSFKHVYCTFKMYLIAGFDVMWVMGIPKQLSRNMRQIQRLITTNELLLDKRDSKAISRGEQPWSTEELCYNEGFLRGFTIGTMLRDNHVNLAWFDDILRDDQKYPDSRILDTVLNDGYPTIEAKSGRMVVMANVQHEEDAVFQLMWDKNNKPVYDSLSDRGFYSIVFPAILNEETKEVLLPERFSYEKLMKIRQTIGDYRFQRQYQCRASSNRNSLIPYSLFKGCCNAEEMLLAKGKEGKKYLIVVDSATSDAPTADYCAMTVWEIEGDKMILRHLFHRKGFPINDPEGGTNDQIHTAFKLINDFNKASIVIEKNNAGVSLINGLKAKGIVPIEHYTHNTAVNQNKAGKVDDIIDYIEFGLKGGLVEFPAHPEDEYTLQALEKVKQEHLNFGVKKVKNGESYEALSGHDDIYISCVIAFKFRFDKSEPELGACITGD